MQFYYVESIREWLNSSRDYHLGVQLYAVYGDNEPLQRSLSQGYSDFRHGKLVTAMQKLLERAEPVELQIADQPPVTVATFPGNLPEHSTAPVDDPYRKEWLPLYNEMNALRHKLRHMKTTVERGEAAFRILDLFDACRRYWDKRDYLKKHGVPMPEHVAGPALITDRNEMERKLRTIRTYVTKYAKLVLNNPNNATHAKKLDSFTAERDRLEKLLGYERTETGCKRVAEQK